MTPPEGRVDNGLTAPSYIPLADVDLAVAGRVLIALRRARIAAYLAPMEDQSRRRLFVATNDRADARAIVTVTVSSGDLPEPTVADPLRDVDLDAEFAALVSGWEVDTTAALRSAERDLNREEPGWKERLAAEDEQSDEMVWLDDDHFVPPPPPPLPRLAKATVLAMMMLSASILVLGLGGRIGLANDLTLVVGFIGILVAVWMLYQRLRDDPRDQDDDGAVL